MTDETFSGLLQDFHLSVADADLNELHERLIRTVLPGQSPGADWSRGIPVDFLDSLLTRWREVYDWRKHEERLNHEQQLVYSEPGVNLHVVRRPGVESSGLPVLALHGWPYTYAQMLPLADALDGAHELVAPSLPGFIHSAVLAEPFSARRTAEILHRLMVHAFGHSRYLVYGEDVGAPIGDWLAGLYPEHMAGLIASHPSFSAQAREGVALNSEEAAFLRNAHRHDETGYAHQQGTRPDTLAVALQDSPAGLLAWIAEKIGAWSDGGHASGLSRFDADDIITLVSLYWHTKSIGTSFRSYSEPDDFDAHPVIDVPVAVLVNTHERGYPRTLAGKSYTDIRTFSRLQDAGHFTAWENPTAVAAHITALAADVTHTD